MNKEKIIELIKLAALKHKQGKYPETLKLLHPVYGKIHLEKIDSLYKSARKNTIENLKQLLAKGNYTEIMAIFDSFLSKIDDEEIKNLKTLTKRNLVSNVNNPPMDVPIEIKQVEPSKTLERDNVEENLSKEFTSEPENIEEEQAEKTLEANTDNKLEINSEFSMEDLKEDEPENDENFLIDSKDFSDTNEKVITEVANNTKNAEIITKEIEKTTKEISMLEHTPAEMLGETDIFFSENAFVGEKIENDEDSFDLELESGFVQQAELNDSEISEKDLESKTNLEDDESTYNKESEIDINLLIQQGVSLYEVGDIENALKSWEKALKIEPENSIVKSYIDNCKVELGLEEEKPKVEEKIHVEPESQISEILEKKKFSKEELNRIIAIARTGEIDRAKQLIDNLELSEESEKEITEAKYYIKNLEEEFFINKTLAKAEELIDEKQSEKAIKILKKLLDKFPENEKADELIQLAKKRVEFDLISNSEKTIELQIEQPQIQKPTRPSSVRSVRPDSSRQPSIKTKPKKQIPIKVIVIGVLSIIIIAAIYFGYNLISNKYQSKQIFNSLMEKINNSKKIKLSEMPDIEKSKEKELKKQFLEITKKAKHMFNNGNYLFSYYLYIQAEGIEKLSETELSYLQSAKERLNVKINVKQIKRKADKLIKRKKYENAIELYYQLLSTNPENIKYKKQLLNCYLKTGIKYGINGDSLNAKSYFENALILEPSDDLIKKHLETVERGISGAISKKQVKSWFIFFR